MAEPAVTFLLENVQKMMVDQIDLISGYEGELKQLQNDLELMTAFLEESANVREKGKVYRQFEKQIREVVYKAEDTIDDCLRQAAAEKLSRFGKLNPKRVDLAKRVRTLREKEVLPVFSEARAGFASLPIFNASAATAQSSRTDDKKIPPLREDNVVGFDEEADTLIRTLTEESEMLKVISIIGMSGLGKTTLAWKIYKDKRIQYQFPTVIWVYVSQEFNMKEVFLTILKKSNQKDRSGFTEYQLAQEVRSFLEKQKFLLFMDDVWTPEAWEQIKAALPETNKSGKVLITSRDEKVARRAGVKEPHKLGFLDVTQSWKLLQLEVWGKEDECPNELKVIGKDIAQQCGGVPLAIVVIGGILREKFGNVKDEWKKVSTSVTSYLNYHDKEKRTENIILLSYNMLPHDLRDCFLYLGMFPEDYEIPAWKLTRLWIAEGFIQRRPGKSLEEVAQENLVDLVARNLVMVDKTNARGEVKACRVHDMIHEFCRSQSAFAKQNIFQEVKKSKERDFDPPLYEISNSRRLCIHSYVVDFLRKKPKGPYVRSFLCFSKEAVVLQPDYNSSIPDAFSLVRVLDVNPIKFSKFPAKITQLIHLSYIALSGDEFKALPDPVSKLWNLQTIKIDTLSRTFDVKADIWKMMHLRHFKTKAAIVLVNKEGRGKGGENLQTLSRLSADSCTEDVFNRAPNLKNLGIRGNLSKLSDTTCLAKLDLLQKLKLVYDIFPDPISQNGLRALPSPEKFPANLTTLTLSSTYLEWKHMATLGQLRSLEVVKLKEYAFMGKHWEAVDGGFPCLEVLHIALTDLVFWTASGSDPFPRLKCLQLNNCEKLEDVPLSVLEKSLEVLNIERVTKSVVKLATEMEEKKKQEMPSPHTSKRGTGFKLIIAPGDGR
ncbi:hypothetical protein ACS0TY_030478 [Phlomoides rotata]